MIIKQDYGTLTGGEVAVESIIAPVQKTLTAERAYAAGDYFIYDDKMYKATSAITAGSAIVLSGSGANATPAGTVGEFMEHGKILSYTTNGLTTSKCNIEDGGYAKLGNLVIVNIRIKVTEDITTNESVISGLPQSIANLNNVSFSTSRNDLVSVAQLNGTRLQLAITSAVLTDSILLVSGAYLCR